MTTIGVFSSYEPQPLAESRTFRGLAEGLRRCGLTPGRDLELLSFHSNDLGEHATAAERWLRDRRVGLIFAGGSPVAWAIRQAMTAVGQPVPLVYFGAHPIDRTHEVGLERLAGPDTACVRMQLPLTYSHRTFRLLRALFPAIERIHIAFARHTIFCHDEMAAQYDRARASRGPHAWVEGDEVGFPSIRDLCWLIDAGYREYPLHQAAELAVALASISPRCHGEPVRDVMVAFNDTYHIAGTPSTLLRFSRECRVPGVLPRLY